MCVLCVLGVQGMRVDGSRAHGLRAESASLGAAGRGWSVCVSMCVWVVTHCVIGRRHRRPNSRLCAGTTGRQV